MEEVFLLLLLLSLFGYTLLVDGVHLGFCVTSPTTGLSISVQDGI